MKSKEFIEGFREEDLIKQYCQPFLQQSGGMKMYRGINSGQDFLKKKARLDNRNPKDSSRKQHDDFNSQFLKQYGENFRNGIFTNGDESIAGNYGDIYSIYPIGDFKFLWSRKVQDLAMQFSGIEPNMFKQLIEILFYKRNTDSADFIKKANYQTSNLKAAINSGNEIMIFAKEYYAMREL